jgi:hypothetical protein
MTAVPRFTETFFANNYEVFVPILGFIGIAAGALFDTEILFTSSALFTLMTLMRYAFVRFKVRQNNPPFSFIFVGIGLVLGFLGYITQLFATSVSVDAHNFARLGKLLNYQGMVLALILGVGSRLIPAILGFVDIIQKQRSAYEHKPTFIDTIPWSMRILGVLFLISFPAEVWANQTLGRSMRAIVVTVIGFQYWRLHSLPKKRNMHTTMIWLSSWSTLVGCWLYTILPGLGAISGMHMTYIGGFALLTFMIASRVVVAHSSIGLAYENNRWPYIISGACFLLAAATRASAQLIPNSYVSHLGYASLCFFVGALAWGFFFIKKMFAQ